MKFFARNKRVKRTAVVTAALALASLPWQTPAGAAAPAAAGNESLVVTYDNERALGNVSVKTLVGTRTAGGGCSFRFPELRLSPAETALEARQIETNFNDCTTKLETGVPLVTPEEPTDGTSENEIAKPGKGKATPGGGVVPLAVSSSGYYRFWWEDVIHLRVHEVKSNISWTWGGSCVTASSGSADYWWLSGTGWAKDSSGSWIDRFCSNAKVHTDATYRNGAFCWPGTVWSYYRGVSAQGKSDGWLVGWVDSSWNSYPFACPTLHYHSELRRVTG